MNRHDAHWLRPLIYIPCGALLWGAAACLAGSPDSRVTAAAVVSGAVLGLLFSFVPRKWR